MLTHLAALLGIAVVTGGSDVTTITGPPIIVIPAASTVAAPDVPDLTRLKPAPGQHSSELPDPARLKAAPALLPGPQPFPGLSYAPANRLGPTPEQLRHRQEFCRNSGVIIGTLNQRERQYPLGAGEATNESRRRKHQAQIKAALVEQLELMAAACGATLVHGNRVCTCPYRPPDEQVFSYPYRGSRAHEPPWLFWHLHDKQLFYWDK